MSDVCRSVCKDITPEKKKPQLGAKSLLYIAKSRKFAKVIGGDEIRRISIYQTSLMDIDML